jgi:hypothetical protein
MGRYTQFLTTPTFRKSFSRLTQATQEAAREKFRLIQTDPFHPSLRPHLMKSISSTYSKTIYAVEIVGDLRAVFYLEAEKVIAFDLAAHEVYR